MPATIQTFDAILQDFYLGPIQEQLNNEVLALDLMEKVKVDWNGRRCIIPVHITRNDSASLGTAFVGENQALPAAGEQGYEDLSITARFQYGRFSVTGPAMASARKGGTHTFISWVDGEMKSLVTDIRDTANKTCIFGGATQGYISCHAAVAMPNATTAVQVTATLAADVGENTVVYDGSFAAFNGGLGGAIVANATPATWVPVDLIRMDTYNSVDISGAGIANNNFWVSDFDAAAGTITIAQGTNTIGGGDTWTTASLTGNSAVAVVLSLTQHTDSAPVVAGAVPVAFVNQPSGIFDNLSNPTHFGVTRNDVDLAAVPAVSPAGNAPALRSKVITSFIGATPVTGARAALVLTRLQQSIDELLTTSTTLQVSGGGQDPSIMLMNPLQRQSYVGLLQGTLAGGAPAAPTQLYKDSSKATQGDAGFTGLSYGGMPMKVSRDMPNGMIAFLRTEDWCIAELQKPGFADLDGNVLSRRDGFDDWQGFYRWYYNTVCKKPNANIILTGLTL